MPNNAELITIKRTFFRTFALLLLFTIFIFGYRGLIQPYSDISILTIFSDDNLKNIQSFGLIIDLIYFAITFILLQIIWSYIICISCKPFFNRYKNNNIRTLIWLIIATLHLLISISANSYYTPTSILAIFRNSFLSSIIFIYCLGFCLALLFIGSLIIEKMYIKTVLIVSILGFFSMPYSLKSEVAINPSHGKPNIIIIGLDGLRPDRLNVKYKASTLTPYLDEFIKTSISYKNSYTPLARTFVAWFSLLKSQYPISHGARFNLTADNLINKEIEINTALKKEGYQSLYAMDERRFNHIDESYGFDLAIGPNTGFADQMITSIIDIPIINLLSNTKFSEYFLPYIFTNRGNGKTYDPIVFNDRVLNNLSVDKANFLAVHFCMLHWPYTSKDFFNADPELWDDNYYHFMYLSLLEKLDKQFKDFMQKLEQKGMLENAIVVVFSDHGESFNLTADKLSAKEVGQHALKVDAWGHGTNILDQKQAKVLLAYNEYKNGKKINEAREIQGNHSIIDIIPTIAQRLNIDLKMAEGTPLPMHNDKLIDNKYIFVESSLPVEAINNSFINTKKIFYETQDNYSVNSQGKLIMKPEKHFEFIAKKQRSVYFKDWQLVMLPDIEDLIVVDLIAENWSLSSTYNGNAPVDQMLYELCKHYENDYQFDPNGVCTINVP